MEVSKVKLDEIRKLRRKMLFMRLMFIVWFISAICCAYYQYFNLLVMYVVLMFIAYSAQDGIRERILNDD